MNALTIRLPVEVSEKLEELAAQLDSSTARLAAKAVEEFVAREAAELDSIRDSLAAAERGEFATKDEVKAVFKKYSSNARFL